MCTLRGGVLDDEERVEPLQADRVDMEQIACQDRLSLHAKDCDQVGPGPLRCGIDPGGLKDLPNR